jgi:Family of unknown function (DUF5362)
MEQSTESNLFELHVDHNVSTYLTETAKWAKFMAIMGFIGCGFMVLFSLFIGSFLSAAFLRMGGGTAGLGYMGGFLSFIYIVIAIVYFFPCLYLYNFASKMQVALRSNDQDLLSLSFRNLKSCYRFVGILMIIVLALWVLGAVLALIGLAFGH